MKSLLILFAVGSLGTAALLLRPCQELVASGSTYKTVKYTGVDQQAISEVRQKLDNLVAASEPDSPQKFELENIRKNVDAIKKTQAVTVEFHAPEGNPSKLPYIILWTAILVAGILQSRRSAEVNNYLSKTSGPVNYPSSKSGMEFRNNPASSEQVYVKDFNQMISDLSVKLNNHFQASGKFLDIEFKKDLPNFVLDKSQLESMCSEFILCCHSVIKDRKQFTEMHLRTDDVGQRLVVGCFIPDLSEQDLAGREDSKKILKQFWLLETNFPSGRPEIHMKTVTVGEVAGLDITMSFENRSLLVTQLKTSLSRIS